MVDELAVTNEIWRRWGEMKIIPPMTWAELRKKVEEYVKAGKDPYDILRGPAPSKEWMEKKGFVEAKLPWPNPEPEAIVEEVELQTFALLFLSKVTEAWTTKETQRFYEWIMEPTKNGVLVGREGAERPHEFFPEEIIKKIGVAVARFGFPDQVSRNWAKSILSGRKIHYIDVGFPTLIVSDPDYALEVLAGEGLDTSKILVERT
jgi:hypothetical protein